MEPPRQSTPISDRRSDLDRLAELARGACHFENRHPDAAATTSLTHRVAIPAGYGALKCEPRGKLSKNRQIGLSFASTFLVSPSNAVEPVLTTLREIVYVAIPQLTSPRRFVVPESSAPPFPQATAVSRTNFHAASQG